MKWFVRILFFSAVIIAGIQTMPVIYVNSGDNVSTSIRYVALGDSIAYGYGLKDREWDSYAGKVCAYLGEKFDHVLFSNFGCNGQRSDELLDILTNRENENYGRYHETLKYADIITLSIGSNDLLHLIEVRFDMQKMIQEKKQEFGEACRIFSVNFPKIIKKIREINPDARIYANNVYNPAKGLESYSGIYETAEHYIGLLNEAFALSKEYVLIDIKARFDREDQSMVNLPLNGGQIDPHPSREGHACIGEMVIDKIKNDMEGK